MKRALGAETLITKKYAKRSQFAEILHRLRKNKGAMAGLIIIAVVVLLFIISLIVISYEMITQGDVTYRLAKPSWKYPFGNDQMGRNLFARVLYGTRYSLAIGFGGSIISAFFGITLGAIAGFYGGMRESLIMRFTDILSSVPGILLGMVIVTALGPSLINLVITVGITCLPIYIRMTRSAIISLRNLEFVEAAHAIGLSNPRIIITHILPNGMSPIIITFTMHFGVMIIIAAGLSYLGYGIAFPKPEWGALISGSKDFMRVAPHLLLFPGLFIMVTVLAFNLLGDGLRDALDPKLKQ